MLGPPPDSLYADGKFARELLRQVHKKNSVACNSGYHMSAITKAAPQCRCPKSNVCSGDICSYPCSCIQSTYTTRWSHGEVQRSLSAALGQHMASSSTSSEASLFLDLIARLLSYDPSERVSAPEALCHPFLAPVFPFGAVLRRHSSASLLLDHRRESSRGDMPSRFATVESNESTATEDDAAFALGSDSASHSFANAVQGSKRLMPTVL